jgi:hypothetical protein
VVAPEVVFVVIGGFKTNFFPPFDQQEQVRQIGNGN